MPITIERDQSTNDKDSFMVIEWMHPASLILKRGTQKECEDFVREAAVDRRQRKSGRNR